MAKNGGPMPQGGKSGYNVALVGASSLQGKEIRETLEERHFPLSRLALLDAEDVGGQLTEFDDAPAIILPISRESFEDIAVAFFAASPAFTQDHWQMAESNGCEIIDLSYFLETNPQAKLCAPVGESLWADGARASDVLPQRSRISVSGHPVAIAVAGILARLHRRFVVERSVVTVYKPVSEHGKAGVDELHQQTVKLLAFQKIPRAVFHSQVAFNLLATCSEQSRPTLREVQQRIQGHVAGLLGGRARPPALRVLQAPIFFGYAFSCFVELKEPVPSKMIEKALDRKPLAICRDPEAQPSMVEVAGSDEILLGPVESDPACESGYWVWGVLDNLRFAALNAVQIAEGLVNFSEK